MSNRIHLFIGILASLAAAADLKGGSAPGHADVATAVRTRVDSAPTFLLADQLTGGVHEYALPGSLAGPMGEDRKIQIVPPGTFTRPISIAYLPRGSTHGEMVLAIEETTAR